MREILNHNPNLKPPKVGEIVEGKVLAKKSSAIYLDLGIWGTGIIYGKEFKKSKGELKKLKIGDKILAKIVELENEEGFVELSVKGAEKEIALELLKKKKEAGEKLKVKILGANKGGFLTKISGISAFLPISQLSPESFPELETKDSEKILETLKKFIGKEIEVKILGILEDGEVILSEKLAKLEEKEKEAEKLKVGEIVEGEISGIFDFGVFLKFGNDFEGLIPSSEINFGNFPFKLGDKLRAKIIQILDKKIFLSLKI